MYREGERERDSHRSFRDPRTTVPIQCATAPQGYICDIVFRGGRGGGEVRVEGQGEQASVVMCPE